MEDTDETTTPEAGPLGDAIEVETLEASGFIMDSEGRKFAVPDENSEDFADLASKGEFDHFKYDPRFHYQIIKLTELDKHRAQGYQPCTKRELGADDSLLRDVGQSPTEMAVYEGSCIFVKIPKIVADRRRAARTASAQLAVEATEPSEDQLRARRGNPGLKNRRAGSMNEVQSMVTEERGDGFQTGFERKRRFSDRLTS